MRRPPVFVIVILVGLWMFGGCAPSARPPTETPAPARQQRADACEALQHQAAQRLRAVVEAHQACTTDADCVSVSLSTACVDQCAAAINQEGAQRLPAVIAAVNAEVCAGSTEGHCTLLHPPCAPARPPACVAGRCQ
jgi:hypothetical protein